ncbi:PREDICTED: proteinase inhibitor type-2 CEVI57-like [Ipomoea nil]|uniref:proteinase inhibitor type-2 CEVI57-like n=1 Tax=Ipomoea nil TaxID=35883 RepID=UPI000900AE05|nr:PREDICTED: proteinase inhibitor type-2 CEVI57-like [Ipomoea nil]
MAASGTKLGPVTLLLLLLCGIVVEVKHANAQSEPCPRNCDGRAKVMQCPFTDTKYGELCTNCCIAAIIGCTLYDQNGTPYCPEEPSSFRKIVTAV